MIDAPEVSLLRAAAAFLFVIALLAGLAAALKMFHARGFSFSSKRANARRISLIETFPLDPKRRFVIVKCDDKEHLLLLSAHGDMIVQSNLTHDDNNVSKA